MSHAEYGPKRLPVLTRLAMALRQIPAVEFALSKFKTLLRGRTNEEPAVTSTLLPPASGVANEDATGAIAKQPVEFDTAADGSVETDVPSLGLSGNEAVEIDAGEIASVETEACTSAAGEIAPDATDGVAGDDLGPVAPTCEPSETHAEPVVMADGVAPDTVEIDVGETPPFEIVMIADDTDETIVEADEIAPDATASDNLPEEELAADEKAVPAAADEIEIEIEAVEAPGITAEPVGIEAAEPCASDAVEAPALGDDDIASPEAAASDQTAREPEPVAVTPDVAVPDAVGEREALIRRRWKETGIMMWRGVGQSTLCIQGSTALLPPKPGETMPQYDRLEFRLIDGLIVCEGFVVEAAPLKNRLLAQAA